ncbi:hypothetical protein K439DRAFT_1324381, partial [Ramaria rubella]
NESSDDDGLLTSFEALPPLSQTFLDIAISLHSTWYLNDAVKVPKTGAQLYLFLHEYKHHHPTIFHSFVHVTPSTFDTLVCKLQGDPVFHNNSQNKQITVEKQLAVVLYRFGHFGNAASAQKVGLWAGLGYGTVDLCTRQVMEALCHPEMRLMATKWPDSAAKAKAKAWVQEQSCPMWKDGWSMVDGTLVPLFARPGFFGNTFFDRKSNYSMTVQLISTPDLRIIDYGVGMPGSQHDATAWLHTRIPQEHDTLLSPREWVWGDSAYPLQTWCQAPYKK